MLRNPFALIVPVLVMCLILGCGEGGPPTATIDGKVTHEGTPVPSGSRIIFEDEANGIRMLFDVGADGAFTVNDVAKLPAGTYSVAVVPPPQSVEEPSEEEYDQLMSNTSAEAPATTDEPEYPVPEKFRDPKTSGKTVDVGAGSQTIEIDFAG